jgi:hypothetical protein
VRRALFEILIRGERAKGFPRCKFRGVGGTRAVEQPQELRELAIWYRSRAELGSEADRDWRAGFAEYLEKRAAEIEQLLACGEKRGAH